MTAKNNPFPPDDASLDQHIRRVEQRLLQRRASSRQHLALIRSQLRTRMTSPLALLLAGGVGFALGASKDSSSAAASPTAPTTASANVSGVRLLPTVVSMVSLAGSMLTVWQRFSAAARPAERKQTTAAPKPAVDNVPQRTESTTPTI